MKTIISLVIFVRSIFSVIADSSDYCSGAGLMCASYCDQCFPGGWCIKNANGSNSGKCLCNYGWTGPLSSFKEDTADLAWGKNRIIASNCKTACHYTNQFRNLNCVFGNSSIENPTCNPSFCEANKRGKCVDGVCKCCKGWTGENAIYSNDRYSTDGVLYNCNKQCPYLGFGVQNPTCKAAYTPPICNSNCAMNDGECDLKTGRCRCCEGWTGENARFEDDGSITVASYCNVYCPYIKTQDINSRNWLCVNPDFIRRSVQ